MMVKGLRLVDIQTLGHEIMHVESAAAAELRRQLDAAEQQVHKRDSRIAQIRAETETVRAALRGLYNPQGVTKQYPHYVKARRAGVLVARICTCARPLGELCISTARETGEVIE